MQNKKKYNLGRAVLHGKMKRISGSLQREIIMCDYVL